MILAFSGDPFLAHRAARQALREQGVGAPETVHLGDGMEPEDIERTASQGGLFGRVAVLCDFDAAFSGQAGVKPRNQALEALARLPQAALVVVVDSSATPSRQKRYRALGRLQHLPAPRFERLPRWVADELRRAGVRFEPAVPQALAELFGEDPAAIAMEVEKLAVLDESLTAERVRVLANRPAARNAFDLIDAIVSGDAGLALAVARGLLERGEPVPRVFGALSWQLNLVARALAAREGGEPSNEGRLAARPGVSASAARRAAAIAARLDEDRLGRALSLLVAADRRAKTGGDPEWALQGAVLSLSRSLAPDPGPQASSSGAGAQAR